MELAAQKAREGQIRIEQVRLLYANAKVAVLVSMCVAAALSYLQWDVISHRTILGWLLFMFVVSSARMVLAVLHQRTESADGRAEIWGLLFTLGAGLSAATWGAADIFLYPASSLINQVFLVFVLGGMMLGAASLLAARPEAFLSFIVTIGAATTLRLVLQNDSVHLTMALVSSIFTIATLIAAWHVYGTVRSSLTLQFENQGLVSSLQAAMRRVEDSLRDREEYLALAQRTARLGVWDCDLRTKIMAVSPEYARLHGLSPDRHHLTHEQWLDLIHPEDRERLRVLVPESLEQSRDWDAEFRVVWADGTIHWLLAKGTVYCDDIGQPQRMAGVSLDITSRKETETVLRESEERFRKMADSAPVMMWVAGADKVITFFNKTWLEFVGRTLEQELNSGWVESVHPDDRQRCLATYSAAFDAREDFQIDYRLRRSDGEYRSVLRAGVPRFALDGAFLGYIGSDIDLTDVRRVQEEAFERQKLTSMGGLINGIAHDFNNLLHGILLQTELAESEIPTDSLSRENLRLVKVMTSHAAEIVRELMIYSGQGQAELGLVEVSSLVQEMLELLKTSISKNAVLKAELAENLPSIRGNAAQLRQVVMNLIINASEAIGAADGVIHVKTSYARGWNRSGSGAKHFFGADWVRLEVSDTGCGMSEEQKHRIFDPFFTTKLTGRGIGLAVVHGIVTSHGGTIEVQSGAGSGSRFGILLPTTSISEPNSEEVPVAAAAEKPASPAGTVLVIEDEEVLRRGVSQLLRARGLCVLEAANGTIGVDLFRASSPEIDVVLLDMTLPGMSGREVLSQLRQIQPDVQVVVTSAYSRDNVLSQIGEDQPLRFIRKPYQSDELMESLSPLLRQPAAGSEGK